jgi:5-methylcytosine-specific restriction protein A
MSGWKQSDRRDRLPPDWAKIRKRVLKRDGWLCQWKLDQGKCLRDANEVDHIEAGDNHDERNLRALCAWHHAKKSGGEGARASWAKRRQIDQRFRRTEDHPGLL